MEMENTENKEVANLQKRLQQKDDELYDATRFFNLCIVETTNDLKIINIYGDTDFVFAGVQGTLKNQSNLASVVNKLTGKSSFEADAPKPAVDNNTEETAQKETGFQIELKNFIDSPKQEKSYQIIGSNSNKKFLLKWVVNKNEVKLKHYFHRIEIDQLTADINDQHDLELKNIKDYYYQIINNVSDGIVILDDHSKIEFLNDVTRNQLTNTNRNKLFNKMNLEGKNFNEVFIIDEPELTKKKMDVNSEVFQTGKAKTYVLEENDVEMVYKVVPLKVEDDVKALGIISSVKNDNPFNGKVDIKKIMLTLKKYTEDNKVMQERINELENNHNWFMKNQRSYQMTIKTLYSYLEKLPIALSIQELPSQKYVFINAKMEAKLDKKRDAVLSKTDSDIYDESTVAFMENALNEGLLVEEEIDYNHHGSQFRQKVLFNNTTPTHVIKIFID